MLGSLKKPRCRQRHGINHCGDSEINKQALGVFFKQGKKVDGPSD
jgi:hypothetical protein